MTEPVWIESAVVLAIHDMQIAEHGGAAGIRDTNLLESALARPQHLWSYEEPDLCGLAAAYGFGVARNHPFVDGNKRTAFVVMELFLALNAVALTASDADSVVKTLELAAGSLSEEDLAAWLRANTALL